MSTAPVQNMVRMWGNLPDMLSADTKHFKVLNNQYRVDPRLYLPVINVDCVFLVLYVCVSPMLYMATSVTYLT